MGTCDKPHNCFKPLVFLKPHALLENHVIELWFLTTKAELRWCKHNEHRANCVVISNWAIVEIGNLWLKCSTLVGALGLT